MPVFGREQDRDSYWVRREMQGGEGIKNDRIDYIQWENMNRGA